MLVTSLEIKGFRGFSTKQTLKVARPTGKSWKWSYNPGRPEQWGKIYCR